VKPDDAAIAPPAGWTEVLRVVTRLMRIERPLCATAFTFLGAWLVAPLAALWSLPVLNAAACVFCTTAFGFVINDCCDVEVDTIARPARPLPAGQLPMRTALSCAWGLAAAGAVLALPLGAVPALIVLGALVLSGAYSYRLKRTLLLGNASVALLVAGVLVFGAVVAGELTPSVWTAAAITFCYVIAQEVVFTLEDEAEDRAAGLSTTATILGPARTARLARALLVLFAAIALAPALLGRASAAYVLVLAAVSLVPGALLWWWLRAPLQWPRVARAVRLSRVVWLTSFLPLALLK
jgi:geranylgeranylglycerol-phosphate geranylgeranyltransferase